MVKIICAVSLIIGSIYNSSAQEKHYFGKTFVAESSFFGTLSQGVSEDLLLYDYNIVWFNFSGMIQIGQHLFMGVTIENLSTFPQKKKFRYVTVTNQNYYNYGVLAKYIYNINAPKWQYFNEIAFSTSDFCICGRKKYFPQRINAKKINISGGILYQLNSHFRANAKMGLRFPLNKDYEVDFELTPTIGMSYFI